MRQEKIQISKVDYYLEKYEIPVTGSDLNRIQLLGDFFARAFKVNKSIQMAHCESCDLYSFAHLPECPFCGDSDQVMPPDEDPEEPEEEEEEDEQETAIAKIQDGIQIKDEYSIHDLDIAVKQLRRHRNIAARHLYQMGKILSHIHQTKIWRLRLNPKTGKTRYKDFQTWVKAELSIPYTQAMTMIRISHHYNEKQIKEFGKTRLQVGLTVPEEAREKFLEEAKEIPTSKVRKIRDLRDQHVTEPVKTRGKPKKGTEDPAYAPENAPRPVELAEAIHAVRDFEIGGHRPIEAVPEVIGAEVMGPAVEFVDDSEVFDDNEGPVPTHHEIMPVPPAERKSIQTVSERLPQKRRTVSVDLNCGTKRLPVWRRPTDQRQTGQPTEPASIIEHDPWVLIELSAEATMYVRFFRNKEGFLEAFVEVEDDAYNRRLTRLKYELENE